MAVLEDLQDYFYNPGMQALHERAKAKREYYLKGEKLPKFPEYVSGARAIVFVNDFKLAACLDCSWSVSIEHQETRTLDANVPWELTPGQISIEASLKRLIHPDATAASDHLFTTIQSSLHTPSAKLEVRDKLGKVLFIAKGSFTSLRGAVSVGQLGVESVEFKGYYWKQNDQQAFDPEILSRSFAERLKTLGEGKLSALRSTLLQIGA